MEGPPHFLAPLRLGFSLGYCAVGPGGCSGPGAGLRGCKEVPVGHLAWGDLKDPAQEILKVSRRGIWSSSEEKTRRDEARDTGVKWLSISSIYTYVKEILSQLPNFLNGETPTCPKQHVIGNHIQN